MIEANTLTGNIESNELTGSLDYREVDNTKIEDVLVDGTSVVENKVANIDLTGKQDALVSGTNIKTINNESVLGEGNISVTADIPLIYFAKLTEMFIASIGSSINTKIDETELVAYNNACLKANQFIPLVIKSNEASNYVNFYVYPRIRFNGKLQYMSFALKSDGTIFVSQSAEIDNPVIGSLTRNNLTFTTFTNLLATKSYVDGLVGDIETLLGGI